jgi:hypothetical protein
MTAHVQPGLVAPDLADEKGMARAAASALTRLGFAATVNVDGELVMAGGPALALVSGFEHLKGEVERLSAPPF